MADKWEVTLNTEKAQDFNRACTTKCTLKTSSISRLNQMNISLTLYTVEQATRFFKSTKMKVLTTLRNKPILPDTNSLVLILNSLK